MRQGRVFVGLVGGLLGFSSALHAAAPADAPKERRPHVASAEALGRGIPRADRGTMLR
jgi:hypothetical protein